MKHYQRETEERSRKKNASEQLVQHDVRERERGAAEVARRGGSEGETLVHSARCWYLFGKEEGPHSGRQYQPNSEDLVLGFVCSAQRN